MGVDTSQAPKRRRAWLAALLSLSCPGLGQLYNAQDRRCVAFLRAYLLVAVAFLAYRWLVPPANLLAIGGLLLLLLGLIAVAGVAALDAARVARRVGPVTLGRWNRPLVYIGLWVVVSGGTELVHGIVKAYGSWDAYSIPAGSMSPTIVAGDRLLAWKNYYADHEPRRGDIAVFKLPRDNRTDYVKRIVGLPGDRVQIKGGILYLNDAPLARERIADHAGRDDAPPRPSPHYVETLPGGPSHQTATFYRIVKDPDESGPLNNTPVFTVPPESYFVLGDNRDNSLDSRMDDPRFGVGYVPRANLRDRPTIVFWSGDLGRIGLSVQPR